MSAPQPKLTIKIKAAQTPRHAPLQRTALPHRAQPLEGAPAFTAAFTLDQDYVSTLYSRGLNHAAVSHHNLGLA